MSQPEPPEGEIQQWTAKRKALVVLDLVRGKLTPADAARQHGLTLAEIEQWKEDFLAQGKEANPPLNSNPICIVFRSLSCSVFHGSGQLPSLRLP